MIQRYKNSSAVTRAHVQMHISILLWGATAVLGRGIQLSEGLLVWYRMFITVIGLGLLVLFTSTSFKVNRKDLWELFVIGTLLMVHWLFFYGAIKYSNVSITLSIFSSTTLFTAFIEPVVTTKRFNKTELLYSLMAIAGIALIFYSDKNSYTTGIILALLAAFVGAFFNILNKDIVHRVSTSVVTFYEIVFGLLVLTLFLPLYLYWLPPASLYPTYNDWVLLFVLAIGCTQIPLILSLNALKHLSAFTLNLSINLEPVYGIALAFIFFGEAKMLSAGFVAGAALILLSVFLHSYFAKDAEPKSLET